MKSIKQGRAGSLMGCVGGIVFTAAAIGMAVIGSSMKSDMSEFGPMGMDQTANAFGTVFIIIAVGMAVVGLVASGMSLYNAFAKKRFSALDIVDGDEEPDPMNERFGESADFCPACGARSRAHDRFCAKCGGELRGEQGNAD